MDIKGAKALRERLGSKGTGEAQPASTDISEDAPPVYHWLGVPQASPDTADAEDDSVTTSSSLFRLLGLSFR